MIDLHEVGFGLYFPELPTCNFFALTMPEAAATAGRILADHLVELQRSGRPSALQKIREHPDNAGGLALLVSGWP
jgi:hypothetical protein